MNFENDVVLTPEEEEERAKHANRYARTQEEYDQMIHAFFYGKTLRSLIGEPEITSNPGEGKQDLKG